MSKSGSRFGRRSNWFKIHCLLQEQQQQHQHSNSQPPQQQPSPQQQRHHDSSSQNVDQSDTKMKIMESEVSITVHHDNQSMPANHFLTNFKAERKRKKSSSDSGASSTDPDYIPAITASGDTSSDHHQHQHHQHIRRLIDESFISSNAVAAAKKVLSAHSALPPYLLASSRNALHLSAFLETSGKEMRSYKIPMLSPSSPSSSLKRSPPYNLFVQNEPMDLSVKSTKETEPTSSQRALRTCIASHRTSDNSSSSNHILDATKKPVPLDLTL